MREDAIRRARVPLRGRGGNNSPRAGTRVSYRFLRAGRIGIGQLACGQPLCPQCCVGRASPATVLTPSPDVLGQYRRPQSPRSMGARGSRASPPRSAIYLITFPSCLSSAVVQTTVISPVVNRVLEESSNYIVVNVISRM